MNCTFFGHSDAPQEIKDTLKKTIAPLIEKRGVNCFYVGNHGNFDRMVLSVLKELSGIYPIEYYVVYAYLPKQGEDYLHTIFPEGVETVPKRFAISFRNKWLIEHSDIVITFVQRSYGGAAQFKKLAEKKGREIINILQL